MKQFRFILQIFLLLAAVSAAAQVPVSDDRVSVRNEDKVNTDFLEYSPAFYREGIVFITNRHESLKAEATDTRLGQNIMALYESARDSSGMLKNARLFSSELLERVHQGPMTFNRTGETIFFTRNVLDKKDKAKDGLRKLMIYSSEKEAKKWSEPKLLSFNNTECNTLHPAVGATDSILYFASDRPGGFGGMDLYRVEKSDGEWGNPENLGETVNTAGNEVFPFYHPDGTLYFASDNHGSYGGLDIFLTVPEGTIWSPPLNLERPFNSEKDDFGLIVDLANRNGYFSSNRSGGKGGDDIYSFEYFGEGGETARKKKKNIVKKDVKITDPEGNPVEEVTVSLLNLDDVFLGKTGEGNQSAKLVPGDRPGEFTLQIDDTDGYESRAVSDAEGNLNLDVDSNGNYAIVLEKDGFIPKQIIVGPDTDWSTLDFTMRRKTDCVALRGYVRVQGRTDGEGNAQVVFVNNDTGAEQKIYTGPDGSYVYCLPCGQNFSVYAVKNGVSTPPKVINLRPDDCAAGNELTEDLTFSVAPAAPFAEGDIIELPNIYFNFNDAGIRPDAERDLAVVLSMLENTPGLAIELGSHTDARGSTAYNLDLSQRRSESVRRWLTEQGIGIERTAAVGYGESRIRNGCTDGIPCTEAEHQLNRRTEFKVLAADSPLLGAALPAEVGRKSPLNVSPSDNAANAYRPLSVNDEGDSGAFTVYAGVFAQQANALKRVEQVREANCPSAIVTQRGDGKYIVEAQRFTERGEAEELAGRLENLQIGTYIKVMK